MSAAFDTVNHSILFDRLETAYGFAGTVLSWMRSFLIRRDQWVTFGRNSSATLFIKFRVPQGSVLEPLLFVLYTANIQHIAENFNLGVHCYVDRQLYFFISFIMELISNRSFILQAGDQLSRLRRLINGLPQGSVLAPILFNIYTYDLPDTVSKKYVYADDICLGVTEANRLRKFPQLYPKIWTPCLPTSKSGD